MKTTLFYPFLLLFTLLTTIVKSETTVIASGMEAPEGAFWLTTELISLTFTPGCLTTKYCVKPTFKITQTMVTASESPSMSWPINESLTKDGREHLMFTYWTSGEPKLVSFIAEIIGQDPSFGFPRVCDQTPETKVFQPDNAYLRQALALRARRHLGNNEQQNRKLPFAAQVAETPVEFTLVGSCFNATFAVRKHLERCPWCPDRNLHVSLTGNDLPEQAQSNDGNISSLMADDRVFYSFITLCIAFIILVAGVTICLCQLPCCSKKRMQRTKSDKNLINNNNLYHQRALPPFHPMHQTLLKNRQQQMQQIHDDDEHHYQMPMIPSDVVEHRYEAPWDRKYRPVQQQQYWNPKSSAEMMMITSPVESSSALGSISTDRTTIGGGNSGGSLPGVNHYHSGSIINGGGINHGMINADGTVRIPSTFTSTSPISNNSNTNTSRHDDSGLESV